MDTLQQLTGILLRLGIGMIFITVVWFMVSSIYPSVSVKNLFLMAYGTSTSATASSTGKSKDWLPAPGSFGGLFGKSVTPSSTANVYKPNTYVAGQPYNGSDNAYNNNSGGADVHYVTYSYSDAADAKANGQAYVPSGTNNTVPQNTQTEIKPTQVDQQAVNPRLSYIRNLSVYEKAAIARNYSFTGEAREMMFDRNGKFPLIIIDSQGKMGIVGYASSTSNWATPGWVRFNAKIEPNLPKNSPCTLVFESGTLEPSTKKPLRFPLYVTCNG